MTSDWTIPMVDWTSLNWTKYQNGGPSQILALGKQAAERRTVLPLSAPGFNSSYSLQFFGPTLGCQYANPPQQLRFDFYTARTMNRSGLVTYPQAVHIGETTRSLFNTSGYNGSASLLVYSAFTPNTDGFLYGADLRLPAPAVNL